MARKQKSRRKPSPSAGRRTTVASPRATRVQRALVLEPIRGVSRAPRAPRAALARAAVTSTDTVSVTLMLRDVHGRLVRDPEGMFTFRRQRDRRQVADQARLPLRGAAVRFAIPAAGDIVECEIDLQRYRFTRSPLFMRAAGHDQVFDGLLLREPEQWTPKFTPWAALPAAFASLRTVLTKSKDIALLGTDRTLPSLADAAYDDVVGADVVMAKTALLNLHYRLRTAGPPIIGADPWFSFVNEIIAIDRERFVGWVKPAMARVVREILADKDDFGSDFEDADASLHRKNVPAEWQARVLKMFSIKSAHDKGNYQLTLVEFSGTDAVLLDADIDESGTFWGHARDVFKHKVTGGTHPVDVHEILVRQEGAHEDFDLGYTLV